MLRTQRFSREVENREKNRLKLTQVFFSRVLSIAQAFQKYDFFMNRVKAILSTFKKTCFRKNQDLLKKWISRHFGQLFFEIP